MRRVTELLEFVTAFPESGATVDETLQAYAELREVASEDDLPVLIAVMTSSRTDFWTREMLSEPVADLGGLSVLRQLLTAYVLNIADGHDNDTLGSVLQDLFVAAGEASRPLLQEIAAEGNSIAPEAQWWLDHGLE